MGVKVGAAMYHGKEAHETLYCNKCNHYLGNYHRDKDGNEWYEKIDENWNNCPWCGEELDFQ